MNRFNLDDVRDALRELSDRELQCRLWLSDGSGGSEVSSFVEACEQLFDDSGLDLALEAGKTGFGIEAVAAFGELSAALRKVNDLQDPMLTIDEPAMTRVRSIASRLVGLIEDGRSMPSP